MSVTDVTTDTESHRMTITAEFDAPVARVWQVWADPRQLEKWWGPPTYPATVHHHDLTKGGRVTYSMTGPEGDTHHGYWNIVDVDPPRRLVLLDGFADENGTPNDELPTTTSEVTLVENGTGTRMRVEATFASLEAMEQMLEMGMREGILEAMGQLDAIIAA